ncbi:MoxR-like ATPase [Rhodovulum bhavnagarense]|uniref:MoxR-like ATPase n=1 Tax=Rhodovulum bhavnagarense TaxID=992286 RepID=A0A4R2RGF7_9RHOB|nr:MoxR family ATPase [Rhodovulum bhavnagarense]TCP58711.1 MoxR-like ATPase [Rhodovulum bhavnagarense]
MSVNAMTVSAGEALEVLRAGWQAQSEGQMLASYMMHGRPGVGKTQIVAQLAQEKGALLFDLRLTTIEPHDLRGLPYYDHDTQKTRWYRPEDLPDDPAHPAILFLDELTAASPMLQPTVYGLLQERRVGRHRLPGNVFVVAAGNTVEDGAIAYQMNTALSDRLIHLHVQAAATDWLDSYAVPRGLHPAVIAFIKTRADLLDTTERALAEGMLIATTPRSWERVSQIMRAVPDRRIRNVLIAGTLGEAVAAEFAMIADDIAATVQVHDMLEADRKTRIGLYPASMHGLNALIYGLIGVLDGRNVEGVIDVMADIRILSHQREEPEFKRMPLGELTTYGFEGLIRKGLDLGLGERFLSHDAYKTYAKERQEAGLA